MSRRPTLTKSAIIGAALSLADTDGLESLSMRRLATELSVKAMSLYNHVSNRDEIVDALVERVIEEMGAPDLSLPWNTAIRAQGHATHDALLRHPWASLAIMSRMNIGPARFRYVDRMIGCFLNAGFSIPDADYAMNTVESYIYGFTLQELTFPLRDGTYQETAAAYIDAIPSDRYPYLHRVAHAVMHGEYDGTHDFSRGLDAIIETIQAGSNASPSF